MPTAEGTGAGRGMGQAGGAVSVFVNNAAVRLHVLDNGRVCAPPPVLVVPGMGEYADEYAWLPGRLGDRRCRARSHTVDGATRALPRRIRAARDRPPEIDDTTVRVTVLLPVDL